MYDSWNGWGGGPPGARSHGGRGDARLFSPGLASHARPAPGSIRRAAGCGERRPHRVPQCAAPLANGARVDGIGRARESSGHRRPPRSRGIGTRSDGGGRRRAGRRVAGWWRRSGWGGDSRIRSLRRSRGGSARERNHNDGDGSAHPVGDRGPRLDARLASVHSASWLRPGVPANSLRDAGGRAGLPAASTGQERLHPGAAHDR